jgi:AraC-like DNA-binding protein
MLGTKKITKKDLWHLIPFFVQLIHIIPYWLSSFDYKFLLAQQIIAEPKALFDIPWGWLYPSYFNFFGRPLLGIVYALAALIFLYRNTKLFRYRSIYQNDLFRWFILFLVGIIFLYAVNLSVLIEILKTDKSVHLIMSESVWYRYQGFIYICLGIAPILFPHILYGNIENLKVAVSHDLVKNSKNADHEMSNTQEQQLPNDRLLVLHQQIQYYVDSQKPFVNPDFNLSTIANALDIPEHHLNYYFRYFKKLSFSDYLIQLRIEHAKYILAWGMTRDLKLETVAKASGYEDMRTFIEQFKKDTGLFPSQYMNLMNPL